MSGSSVGHWVFRLSSPILALALAVSAFGEDKAVASKPDPYAVYNSLLIQAPLGYPRPRRVYVIEAKTYLDRDLKNNIRYLKRHFPTIDSTVVDSLIMLNVQPERLDKSALHFPVILIEREDLGQIAKNSPSWKEFEERFPGSYGAFAVSKVSFDAEGSRALVYWQFSCGNLCGSGFLTQLNLVDGEWLILKTLNLWDE